MKLQHHLLSLADEYSIFDIKNFIRKTGDKYIFSKPWLAGEYYFEILTSSRTPMANYTTNAQYGFAYATMGDVTYDAFLELAAEIDNTLLNSNTFSAKIASNGMLQHTYFGVDCAIETACEVDSPSDNSMYCSCKSPLLITNHAMGKEFEYCKTCKKEYVKKSTSTYPEDNGFKWY